MCQIQTSYFTYNGSSTNIQPPCLAHSLDPNGQVNMEADVTFSGLEVGNNYKCGLKFKMPDGTFYEYVTPLRSVRQTESFISANFTTPIPAGQYDLVWISIYDSNGATVCNGLPTQYGCQTMLISSTTSAHKITFTAGAGGQIQVFQNGTDLGYFRGTKTISANDGDNISVWCDADTGYTFTNLCTPDGTCTTSRPFNFVVNMDISMTATFTSTPPQYHNECVNNVCTQVSGAGTDICPTTGQSCGITQPTYACSGSSCVPYTCTIGSSNCYTTNDCNKACGTPPTYQCYQGACHPSNCAPGTSGCYTENTCGSTCSSPNQPYSCVNNICTPDTTGKYPDLATCSQVCGRAVCTALPDEICIPGLGPIKKTYVIYGTIAFFALMMLKQ